ncbi:MAG: PDZ domain-containing protein [Chloroflexi bacterium]|nr:PDZ domain-containing protein [Chloroflexota bacterium]
MISAARRSSPATHRLSELLANPRVLFVSFVLAAFVLAGWLLFIIPTPYQLVMPGPVTDVQQMIRPYPHQIKGALYLTTIYSDPASVGEWLFAQLSPEAGLVPREQARPKNVGEREYQKLLVEMMDESKIAAKVVALRAAGYEVKITGQGAQVKEIAEYSKAKGLLQSGDIIIAVGDQPILTASDLVALIQAHRPGETVRLRVRRGDEEVTVDVPLVESSDEPGRARAGLVVLTHLYQYELPRELDLQTKDVGGPSAGLMFALGIFNAVTPDDITRGHKIAGTGTISTDGKVGPVGGVEYKVRAAERAGAELFLVPKGNVEDAGKSAQKSRVVAVSTFQEALDALATLPPR